MHNRRSSLDNARRKHMGLRRPAARNSCWSAGPVSARGAGSAPVSSPSFPVTTHAYRGGHPLTRRDDNERLYAYERRVKDAFDDIVPTLKEISALQHEADFEPRAQRIARDRLGFEFPEEILRAAWVRGLDMRALYAYAVFESAQTMAGDFFVNDPLNGARSDDFERFLQGCGFHALSVTPCADGRLAHVISYVLRLPYGAVRRKSSAGAVFDVEEAIEKWESTELGRYREGKPNGSDAATRYLKVVVYHHSSSDPQHEGCAAHGSDTRKAAQAGMDRLVDFRTAVENSFCCGASIDLLLIGLDTDNDEIRVHIPDGNGDINLERVIDVREVYEATQTMSPAQAEAEIERLVRERGDDATAPGMVRFITRLLVNNIAQVDYVHAYHGGRYQDIGHFERFIGVGKGFEEVQLRNLTYFAYLNTVEEGAKDLDVGVKIFTGLNIARGLPIPVVVRFDYDGMVPGARERAVARCLQVRAAANARYAQLVEQGMLHCLLMVRDRSDVQGLEVVGCSVTDKYRSQGAH